MARKGYNCKTDVSWKLNSHLNNKKGMDMSFYSIVEYDQASPDVQEIYDDVKNTLGVTELPNWIKCMGENANLLRGNWEKVKHTEIQGLLPNVIKELIIFCISVKRGSKYCSSAHAHSALQLDSSLTYEDLDAIAHDDNYEILPKQYHVAIKKGIKCALEPTELSNEDIEELRDQGFTNVEIQEIFALADLSVMFNTITMAADLEVDDEFSETFESVWKEAG
ncbi:hypothetical protein GCM10007941_36580 [Amphritea balenae]|nr:hypothetical protein GCM10007941_36580 [Amphritea balenae]